MENLVCHFLFLICVYDSFCLLQLESTFCISVQISWPTKLFLAHGVVRGMEYLHSVQPDPVIHGDLKTQNVLVGNGLIAKVCLIVKSYRNEIPHKVHI